MKSIFKVLILVSITLLAVSCNRNEQQDIPQKVDEPELSLIGKKITASYPEMIAEIHYISETELHWKTLDHNNQTGEGNETISYQKVGKNLYFVNWIEKTGETVSQVIDLTNNTVSVFLSYQDDDSTQGKRGSIFFEGSLTVNN